MELVPQDFMIIGIRPEKEILERLEMAGRTCYKSFGKMTTDSAEKFIKNIIQRGHTSVLEHETIQVRLFVDRGVLAELTRHRVGVAFSVESTRYCNYNKDGIQCIDPIVGKYDNISKRLEIHKKAYEAAEKAYKDLIEAGATPQEARQVLPQSLLVNLVFTANIREWRHILDVRTSEFAHPHCRDIFTKILVRFQELYPTLFGDIGVYEEWK